MVRRYQKTQALLPQIQQMLKNGMTQREVAEALGLEGDRPVHALLKREQKKKVQKEGSRCSKTTRAETCKDLTGIQV